MKWNCRWAGKDAFTATEGAGRWGLYRVGTLLAEHYKAHRIIYKMVHGSDAYHIDHINGDTLDNRPCNLRSVTASENGKNQRLRNTNKSGVMGVLFNEKTGRWVAQIRIDYKSKRLGTFDSKEDAVAARKAAETLFGFHENHNQVR